MLAICTENLVCKSHIAAYFESSVFYDPQEKCGAFDVTHLKSLALDVLRHTDLKWRKI